MGVTKKPIYAREALLPMSVPAKSFQKNYVPFVDPTDARKFRRSVPQSATQKMVIFLDSENAVGVI